MAAQPNWIDLFRQSEFQELMRRVKNVGTPVSQCSHTEIVPATPLAVVEIFVVIMMIACHQPGIPVQCFGYRFCCGEFFDIRIPAVPAARVVHVCRDSSDILDDACFLPRFELKVVGFGVTLVSHLGHYFGVFPGCLHHQFRLQKRTAQRLLHIHMLTLGHRHHHCREMGKVGYGNSHRFYLVAHLVEHLPEILEKFRVGEFGQRLFGMFCSQIHIAQGNHIGHACLVEIIDDLPSPVSDSNMCQVHFFVGTHYPVVTCRTHFG